MKTLGISLLFVICFSPTHLFAQLNTPIIGYDKVAWGSSIQTVTQTYTGLREVNSEFASVGVREYSQKNVGGGISERIFYFYQNKLYKVLVRYDNVDADMLKALLEKISSIYGRFDKSKEDPQSGLGGVSMKKYSVYRFYNRNLDIYINAVDLYNLYNVYINTVVGIVYTDPTIQNQIDEALRKEKSDKLQL